MFRELLQVGQIGLDFSEPENSFSITFLNLVAQYLYGVMDFTSSFSSPLSYVSCPSTLKPLFWYFEKTDNLLQSFFPVFAHTRLSQKIWQVSLKLSFQNLKKFLIWWFSLLCLGNLLSFPWKHNHGQPYELVLIYSFKHTYTILHAWYHSKHAEFLQAVFFFWFASSKSALLPITSASRNLIYTFL